MYFYQENLTSGVFERTHIFFKLFFAVFFEFFLKQKYKIIFKEKMNSCCCINKMMNRKEGRKEEEDI
jgi:hypothetical protein